MARMELVSPDAVDEQASRNEARRAERYQDESERRTCGTCRYLRRVFGLDDCMTGNFVCVWPVAEDDQGDDVYQEQTDSEACMEWRDSMPLFRYV